MNTFIILKRAFNNFGDYLIFEKAKSIIKNHSKNIKLIEADGSQSLDLQFNKKEFRKFDGIIIAGGPAIRKNLYSGLYPLSEEVFKNNIPVFILGAGSKKISKLYKNKKFDKQTTYFLKYVNKFAPIGCRDEYTMRYLQKLNFGATLNGCPAWYDLDKFKKRINKNYKIKNVLFSVPGNFSFFEQFIYVIKQFISKYPKYNYYISFNHGFENRFNKIKKEFQNTKIKLLDMSKNVANAQNYDKMDLNIGYRVHTHIYFLSERKPSIILAEDSRGIGVMNTLRTDSFIPGIKCWNDQECVLRYKWILNNKLKKIIFKPYNEKKIIKKLSLLFEDMKSNNFQQYNKIFEKMEYVYEKNTSSFLKKILK